MHARSVTPFETLNRDRACKVGSKEKCSVGYACPQTTSFNDKLIEENVFTDTKGEYCNCWVNDVIETKFVHRLEMNLRT